MVGGLARTEPPTGRSTWTMQLRSDQLVELGQVDAVSDEKVRRTFKRRVQALAEGTEVAPRTERGVRRPHAGCPGSQRRRTGPAATSRLSG